VTSHTPARPVRRLPLLLTVLAAVLGCLTLAPAEAHATPATPATGATGVAGATGATGATAHRAKQVADHSVASLRKRIAATSRSLARLSAAASGAENDYLAQLAAQQRATAAEAEAATAAAAAQHAYDQARSDLVAVEEYAWGARGYIVPEVDHLQAKVASLTAARPARCSTTGRIR